MNVWLLQSKEGGLTCGHLHEDEAAAWRCRGVQADPEGWVVVSARLSNPGRPELRADVVGLALLAGLVFFLLMTGSSGL